MKNTGKRSQNLSFLHCPWWKEPWMSLSRSFFSRYLQHVQLCDAFLFYTRTRRNVAAVYKRIYIHLHEHVHANNSVNVYMNVFTNPKKNETFVLAASVPCCISNVFQAMLQWTPKFAKIWCCGELLDFSDRVPGCRREKVGQKNATIYHRGWLVHPAVEAPQLSSETVFLVSVLMFTLQPKSSDGRALQNQGLASKVGR